MVRGGCCVLRGGGGGLHTRSLLQCCVLHKVRASERKGRRETRKADYAQRVEVVNAIAHASVLWSNRVCNSAPAGLGNTSTTPQREDATARRRENATTRLRVVATTRRRDDATKRRRDDERTRRRDDTKPRRRDARRQDDTTARRRVGATTRRRGDATSRGRDDSTTRRRSPDAKLVPCRVAMLLKAQKDVRSIGSKMPNKHIVEHPHPSF